MAFFAKLKHALGFGDDYADEILCDTEDSSADLAAVEQTESGTPNSGIAAAAAVADDDSPLTFSETMRRRIFDHVVEVFNGSMPVFIRDSVDPNAQSDYIYRTLDESIKEYMAAFEERADQQCRQRYVQREEELNAEITRLQSQSKKIDDDRSAIKERQLSADRQKRALNERVHELEQQLATVDAEREQLQLEIQSLLNKVKVAQIQGSDPELRQQVDTLQAENDDLHTENAKLQDAVKKQSDMQMISETMMGDLRQSASQAREEANKANALSEELKTQLLQLQTRHEATGKRLQEAEELIREASGLHGQLEQLEAKLRKRDERVRSLKDENKKLQAQLSEQLANDSPEPYTAPIPPADAASDSNAPTTDQTPDSTPVTDYAINGAPRISDESLNSIEINFGEEIWSTDTRQTAHPEPKAPRQSRRRHSPSDDMQLSLF